MNVADPNRRSAASGAGWQQLLNLPVGAHAGVHIHLLGIGGSGLSAIATLLLEKGYTVSGSDQAGNEATVDLAGRGAAVSIGHHAQNVAGADLVLVSSAIPAANPEVQAAQAAGIPVVKRADFLGPLMAGQHGVGVAGTHGKTTTTAMLSLVLWRGGADPSFIVGGRLAETGLMSSAARAGAGPFVIEADEYDRMFLGLTLRTAIVTNVEWDHVDCYATPDDFMAAFRQFAGQLPDRGRLILCADDPGAASLADAVHPGVTVTTYGLDGPAAWQATRLQANELGGLDAAVSYLGRPVGALSLAVPGTHNVRNALAAMAAAEALGVPPAVAAAALRAYRGTSRRFEVVGEAAGVTVIDDYGHHPTEVAATLAAARLRYGPRPIWAVFQPHTYSRFQALISGFAGSFTSADEVVLLDIYAAREHDDLGMHSRQLLERIEHPTAHYLGAIDAAATYLLAHVAPGDVVITLSAGDGNQAGHLLLAGLRDRDGSRADGREKAVQAPEPTGEQQGPRGPAPSQAPVLTAAERAVAAGAEASGTRVVSGEPLARHTTFRIGGPADLFAVAGNIEQLGTLAQLAALRGLPFTMLGGGSNVLISDAGIRGLTVANAARGVRVITESRPLVVADSGLPLAGLARWAMRAGWSGLEWAVSVPGTVAGAIIGNAGAYGSQTADSLAWALVIWPDGRREKWTAADLRFAYRSSTLKEALAAGRPTPVVLQAGFELAPGESGAMAALADEYLGHRRATQPVEPSAGSVFRNPPGDFAGRLIEATGLKGRHVGGAQISRRHANFIVNTGHARAADVLELMNLIQRRVREEAGVALVPEILLIGEWPQPALGPAQAEPFKWEKG